VEPRDKDVALEQLLANEDEHLAEIQALRIRVTHLEEALKSSMASQMEASVKKTVWRDVSTQTNLQCATGHRDVSVISPFGDGSGVGSDLDVETQLSFYLTSSDTCASADDVSNSSTFLTSSMSDLH